MEQLLAVLTATDRAGSVVPEDRVPDLAFDRCDDAGSGVAEFVPPVGLADEAPAELLEVVVELPRVADSDPLAEFRERKRAVRPAERGDAGRIRMNVKPLNRFRRNS